MYNPDHLKLLDKYIARPSYKTWLPFTQGAWPCITAGDLGISCLGRDGAVQCPVYRLNDGTVPCIVFSLQRPGIPITGYKQRYDSLVADIYIVMLELREILRIRGKA